MLGETVIVAGNRPGTDVRTLPHFRIADVAQVIGLRLRTQRGRLHLDEVADPGLRPDSGAGPQPRERTDAGTCLDHRALYVREAVDPRASGHLDPGAEDH